MSEAVRAVALAEANKLKGDSGDPAEVVKAAGVFLTFLQGGAGAPAKTSAAGAEPSKTAESKPSANTAGASKPAATKAAATTKPKKPTEEELAAAALKKANEDAAAEGEDTATEQTEPLEATPEGVALAVKLLIEGGKRDDAIQLLKDAKAASVSSMQKKDAKAIGTFIEKANELLGLGGEPSLE